MRKTTYTLFLALGALVFACQKEEVELKNENSITSKEIPQDVISKLQEAGFNTSEGLSKFKNGDEEGYLVEYDIFLTAEKIDNLEPFTAIGSENARVEHYRTNNLVVATPRTIRVYMDPAFGSYLQEACNVALTRYNDLTYSSLRFNRVYNPSDAEISILSFYEVSQTLGFSAGFPTGGNPASPIRLNTYYYNNSSQRADAATTIAHEIGHAIGFRHTDFMNRAFSCGQGGNEGDGGVGAVHIPGTPTGPSSSSWMLACSNNTNRPFTGEDAIAIANVYPPTSVNTKKDVLNVGEALLQNQFLQSKDGRFKLILQSDGNLVIYNSDQPIWHSNTWGKPYITRCVMQSDGNLVLYDNNSIPHWHSNTWGKPITRCVMQSDGNLVLYDNNSIPHWHSDTWGK